MEDLINLDDKVETYFEATDYKPFNTLRKKHPQIVFHISQLTWLGTPISAGGEKKNKC